MFEIDSIWSLTYFRIKTLMQDIPYKSGIRPPVDHYYTFYMPFHFLEFWHSNLFLWVVDLQYEIYIQCISVQPWLEFCIWWAVSSHSSHHPQEVLLAQFSRYDHKGGLKPHSTYATLVQLCTNALCSLRYKLFQKVPDMTYCFQQDEKSQQ